MRLLLFLLLFEIFFTNLLKIFQQNNANFINKISKLESFNQFTVDIACLVVIL